MSAISEQERPFPIPREILDTINSIFWFLMDAAWMLEVFGMAYLCILPTVLTGLALLYVERRRAVFYINLAINCWIWMNTLWMLSETLETDALLNVSRALFSAGVIFIIMAAKNSESLQETFSHFKRFRVLKW